jgi:hypothetical protein
MGGNLTYVFAFLGNLTYIVWENWVSNLFRIPSSIL